MTDHYNALCNALRTCNDEQIEEAAAVLGALLLGGTVRDRVTRVSDAIVRTAIGERLGNQSRTHGAARLHSTERKGER